MFLAEQIRQQQLTAALESRLDPSSFSAIQNLLLMNKLKAGQEQAKILEQVAAGTGGIGQSTSMATVEKAKKGQGKRGGGTKASAYGPSKPEKKNTVASLLAKSRGSESGAHEAGQPELTIEPIYRRASQGIHHHCTEPSWIFGCSMLISNFFPS